MGFNDHVVNHSPIRIQWPAHTVAPIALSHTWICNDDKMEKGWLVRTFLTISLLSVGLLTVGGSRTTSSPTLEEAIANYRGSPRYLNSWAVEVKGGRGVADDLAKKHGFVNRGQVS